MPLQGNSISVIPILLGRFGMKVQACKLTCDNNEVDLTKEFDLLHYLVLNHGGPYAPAAL